MLIAHTIDLSTEDDTAFVHAAALALASGARLASVHARVGMRPVRELPSVVPLLSRWSRGPDAVSQERIVHHCCGDVTETLLAALRTLEPDLLIAATHARSGLGRLIAGSVAEGIARNLTAPALLFPVSSAGFVDPNSGSIELGTLLVPAGNVWEAATGVDAAIWLARLAGQETSHIVMLHATDGRPIPQPAVPPGVELEVRSLPGTMERAILAVADEINPSIIVMTTHNHDGFNDVVLGSHTERVLHRAKRPMLWVSLPPEVPD